MRTKVFLTLLAAVALALPAGALASKAGHSAKKQATYEFQGTLSLYTAAVGVTPGSITIVVSKANKAGRPFVGLTLTFPVAATTKVNPKGAVIVDGHKGTMQVKGAPGLDATGLQLLAPKKIVDQTL